MDNKDYLAMFLLSGFTGLGCKMILSVNTGPASLSEGERKMLDNIPIASVISGLLFLSALKLLPYEDPTEGPEEDR